jgi:pyruvate/2-oxoglutarate dehydrogenase complex dihydrolipoamide dehydrogenase (E3) component
VTLVDMAAQIMPREDAEVAAHVESVFRGMGIELLTGHRAVAFRREDGGNFAEFDCEGERRELAFDRVLVAVGRRANSENLGLEALGIATNPNGTIVVDDFLRTTVPTVFACGDVAGPYQFTHMASHQAWYTAVNALFGFARKFRVDYSVVPWATFTDPEVARVGFNELEAREKHIDYEVMTVPGKDRILGATIVGYHAAELLAEYVLAMKHGIGLNKILGTIHVYPTLSESNKFVAGEWRKARKPEALLDWIEKLHDWRRGRGSPGTEFKPRVQERNS